MAIRALVFDYYGVLARPTHGGWQLDMQLVNLIQNLKRTYKIGLLSNTYAKTLSELNPALDPSLFDLVILGGATGLWKPDEQAFEHICTALDLSPVEILVIDDSPKHLEVATKLGFATLLYRDISDLQKALV